MTSFYDDPSLPDNLGDKAGQRPLQGLLPVVATETGGRCGTRFVTGSADATLLAQVIMNILQFNQTAADAIRSPRIHAKPQNFTLDLEGKSIFMFRATIFNSNKFLLSFWKMCHKQNCQICWSIRLQKWAIQFYSVIHPIRPLTWCSRMAMSCLRNLMSAVAATPWNTALEKKKSPFSLSLSVTVSNYYGTTHRTNNCLVRSLNPKKSISAQLVSLLNLRFGNPFSSSQ